MSYLAVIVAAGQGCRFGTAKQFSRLANKTVLWYALRPFVQSPRIDYTRVIVADEAAVVVATTALGELAQHCDILPLGGKTRAMSVYNGLPDHDNDSWAIIHDAARPCLTDATLSRLLDSTTDNTAGGVALALPVIDALRTAAAEQISGIVERDGHWLMQTPQGCLIGQLRRVLADHPEAADESEAMWQSGLAVRLVKGDRRNIKITHREDLPLAAAILAMEA